MRIDALAKLGTSADSPFISPSTSSAGARARMMSSASRILWPEEHS